VRRTLQEDLQQLQALGWAYERWLRKERIYLSRRKRLTGLEAAPEPSLPFSELQWVVEGGSLSQALTGAQRYLLMLVHNSGIRQAARLTGMPGPELRDSLSRIREVLYKDGGGTTNG
jgi:hypothetical protein